MFGGFIDNVYVQNVNGVELLVVMFDTTTLQFSGDSTSIVLGTRFQQGQIAIDTSSSFYRDFLSVALTLWSTQQECEIAVEVTINLQRYNYICILNAFRNHTVPWHS